MKYIIWVVTSLILMTSCSKSSIQCSKMKPLKHKKYRVKKTSYNRSRSVLAKSNEPRAKRKTNTIQKNGLKSASQKSAPTDGKKKSSTNNAIEPKNSTVEDKVIDSVDDVNENNPQVDLSKDSQKEQEQVEPLEEKEPTILFSSKIDKQTYIKLENQNTEFDPKYHVKFNGIKYGFKENVTLFQRMEYVDLTTEVNDIELNTTLKQLARGNTKSFIIYNPTNVEKVSNNGSKKYSILHVIENDHYEIYNQQLSEIDNIIEYDKLSEEEIDKRLNTMLENRLESIKDYLEKNGIDNKNIVIDSNSKESSIIIEVK